MEAADNSLGATRARFPSLRGARGLQTLTGLLLSQIFPLCAHKRLGFTSRCLLYL